MSVYLDTSALAKLFINEPGSEAFAEYFAACEQPRISSLVLAETRSLLARHRREGRIDVRYERDAFDLLLADVDSGRLRARPLRDEHVHHAISLLGHQEASPLRTLDALHLAVCQSEGIETVATADERMARAATELGIRVDRF